MKSIILILSVLFIGTNIQGNNITPSTFDIMAKRIYVGNLPHHYEPADVNKLVYEVTGQKCTSKKVKPGKFAVKFKSDVSNSVINKLDGYKVEGKSIVINHEEQY